MILTPLPKTSLFHQKYNICARQPPPGCPLAPLRRQSSPLCSTTHLTITRCKCKEKGRRPSCQWHVTGLKLGTIGENHSLLRSEPHSQIPSSWDTCPPKSLPRWRPCLLRPGCRSRRHQADRGRQRARWPRRPRHQATTLLAHRQAGYCQTATKPHHLQGRRRPPRRRWTSAPCRWDAH